MTAIYLSQQLFTRFSMRSLGVAFYASQMTVFSRFNGMLATSHLISKFVLEFNSSSTSGHVQSNLNRVSRGAICLFEYLV